MEIAINGLYGTVSNEYGEAIMMRICAGVCLLMVSVLLWSFRPAAAAGIEIGLWQMNMETRMEGLPFAMEPTLVTVKSCITKKDLVPKDPNAKNCTFRNLKASGNTVTWEYECNQDGSKATGKGKMTYKGTTCSGVTTTVMTSEGQKITATTKIKGNRIGACTGESETVTVNGRDMSEYKEMAEKSQNILAEQEAMKRKGLNFIKKVKVPVEAANACNFMPNGTANNDCDARWGKIDLQEGTWEATQETAATSSGVPLPPFYISTVLPKSCLSPENPVLREYTGYGCDPVQLRRSGNTITWKISCNQGSAHIAGEGGIDFKGDHYDGAIVVRNLSAPDAPMVTYYRMSGKRVGDGECGRAMSGRAYSAKDRQTDKKDGILGNPIRKMKSLFGF